MNKKLAIICVFIVLSVASLACGISGGRNININTNTDIIRGSGTIAEESRALKDFNGVNLSIFGELTIVNGDEAGVTISGDDNLLPYIETKVVNGVLYVQSTANTSLVPKSDFTYVVTVTQPVERLEVSGLGNIQSDNISTGDFFMAVSGAGEIRIPELSAKTIKADISGLGSIRIEKGNAERATVSISGSGQYQAADVECEFVNVNISGLGDAFVWVTDRLEANISGSGDVEYYGRPEIDENVSGLGHIKSNGDR